jgi:hypothetical protein
MRIISRSVLSAAASLVASVCALAQANPPGAPAAPSVLQHNCVLKTLSACNADAQCTPLDNLKGEKLPVKITVDLAAGVVAGVDPEGWVDATSITSFARAADQIILQGVDSAVAWQLLIREKGETMSLSLATAEGASIGFGNCTAVKVTGFPATPGELASRAAFASEHKSLSRADAATLFESAVTVRPQREERFRCQSTVVNS